MTEYEPSIVPPEQLRTAQLIAGALLGGVVIPLSMVLLVTREMGPGDPLFAYVGAGVAVLLCLVSLLLPERAAGGDLRRLAGGDSVGTSSVGLPGGETGSRGLFLVYQQYMMRRLALVEAAALLCVCGYFVSRQSWLFLGVGACSWLGLLYFPTRSRVDSWIRMHQTGSTSPMTPR